MLCTASALKRIGVRWTLQNAIGCELSYLNDVFWNQESIAESNHAFREEDVAAIAYALKRLKSMVK